MKFHHPPYLPSATPVGCSYLFRSTSKGSHPSPPTVYSSTHDSKKSIKTLAIEKPRPVHPTPQTHPCDAISSVPPEHLHPHWPRPSQTPISDVSHDDSARPGLLVLLRLTLFLLEPLAALYRRFLDDGGRYRSHAGSFRSMDGVMDRFTILWESMGCVRCHMRAILALSDAFLGCVVMWL